MKKVALLGLGGLMFVSAAANAISISGQAGEDYTNVGVGFGTETSGLAASATGPITTMRVTWPASVWV